MMFALLCLALTLYAIGAVAILCVHVIDRDIRPSGRIGFVMAILRAIGWPASFGFLMLGFLAGFLLDGGRLSP